MPTEPRRTYVSGPDRPYPAIGMLGVARALSTIPKARGPQRGDRAWRVLFFSSGFYQWSVGKRTWVLPPRTWLVIPPFRTHGAAGSLHTRGALYWLHLVIEKGEALPGLTRSETDHFLTIVYSRSGHPQAGSARAQRLRRDSVSRPCRAFRVLRFV